MWILATPELSADEVSDQVDKSIDVEELQKKLVLAFGDEFEFIGGEVGRNDSRDGSFGTRRFWFARVRPMKAGEYGLGYTTKLDELKLGPWQPTSAVYMLPIKIGEQGAPRIIHPDRWGGSSYPHANVGDTLIVPIEVSRFRVGHKFASCIEELWSFFHVANRHYSEEYLQSAKRGLMVTNEAADKVTLLTSWGHSVANRPGTEIHHSIEAYLEFCKPGEFNICSRFVDVEKEAQTSKAFRVVDETKPVSVLLEYFKYSEQREEPKFRSNTSKQLGGGTIEVRVGDRLRWRCGDYVTVADVTPTDFRRCIVAARKFEDIPPYTSETKHRKAGKDAQK